MLFALIDYKAGGRERLGQLPS